ncbi:MAG: NADH-quinone oxidoreductase subunit G, partial [Burkholderiales bacterium PBB5]
TTMAGGSIDSELSGNMIDVCPVGALTSKPFRYAARTWELSRRKSVSPHDGTGANLVVQVKANQVLRVVPLENEESVDFRTRHADFGNTAAAGQAQWLGGAIAALSTLDAALVVGSFLRKDHPLLAQRLRQSARKGGAVFSLQAVHDDWALPLAGRITAAPDAWVQALANVAGYVAAAKGVAAPANALVDADAERAASALLAGERQAVLLGNAASQHPQASSLLALANYIGQHTGA